MDIEKNIKNIDFSHYSNVKESLRQKLLINRRQELSMDELDKVTAAVYIPCLPLSERPKKK